MNRLPKPIQELLRYPSAVAGVLIILFLLGVSAYAMISIPYSEAIRLWRGGEDVWYKNPKYAPPAWINYFRREKLFSSFSMSTEDGQVAKEVTTEKGVKKIVMVFPFEFTADTFPQDMMVFFKSSFNEKKPSVAITLLTPDGREVRVGDFSVDKSQNYRVSQDTKLKRRVGGLNPEQGLFVADTKAEVLTPLKGHYELRINALAFEEDSDVNAELVVHGQVYGWAGTDHLRRDLGIALLWGTPIALAFGLVAALTISIAHMTIAAVGVWFGGWLDELIQRITEIFLVLPFLPILIMVGTFYSRRIWVIFGATILLSLFGGAIKNLRATFMQIKESPYIEAARSYGAGNTRIIFLYLIPRLIPLLIPALVTAIPAYVFLEASLAVLGLGDPILPTWGKVINDASANGALYKGLYYWVLEPAVLLMIAGLAFAMLGFSMDRIFNPRLRGL